jgi:hypothetical protein
MSIAFDRAATYMRSCFTTEKIELGLDICEITVCVHCDGEIFESSPHDLRSDPEFTHFASGRRACHQPGEVDQEWLVLVATPGATWWEDDR